MEIPADLQNAIEEEIKHHSIRQLAGKVRQIQESYRKREAERGKTVISCSEEAKAYLVYRFPATFRVLARVFEDIRARRPDFVPQAMLDLGAGPGTSFWAALETWPSMREAEFLENNQNMEAIGRRLMNAVRPDLAGNVRWKSEHREKAGQGNYDIVTASYVMGEIPPGKRKDALKSLWEKTADMLIIVEPAKSPGGFLIVREVRERLLELGGNVVAPCPHGEKCPKGEERWCHFGHRISRGRAHRMAKGGARPYEDEKVSWLAVTRKPYRGSTAVLTLPPAVRKRHVILEACTAAGLKEFVVTGKNRDAYKRARKMRWGESLPEGMLESLARSGNGVTNNS